MTGCKYPPYAAKHPDECAVTTTTVVVPPPTTVVPSTTTTTLVPPISVVCTEDMSCWDCATMGDHRCATTTVPTERVFGLPPTGVDTPAAKLGLTALLFGATLLVVARRRKANVN